MLFQTSTPKKRTFIPIPRSSTPNQFYHLIKKKIKVNHNQPRITGENCCPHYPIPMIQLDLLLYRPKTECYRQKNIKQIWAI
jgi:hypothetical protein